MTPEWLERAVGEARAATPDAAEQAAIDRLASQLSFVLELDRAKRILRRNYLSDSSRLENDAEHMWHVTLAALVLAEHADEPVDGAALALMLAVHDVVEIDAGDTFIYDEAAKLDQAEREARAAERLFGLLPADQAERFTALWDEFEGRETATSRMARAIDRLLPFMLNRTTGGRAWRENGITADRVTAVNSQIGNGSARLWAVVSAALRSAGDEGVLEAPGAEPASP